MLPEWEKHLNTFEDYKVNGNLPDIYGRDASLLSHPHVHHIHLAHTQELADEWARRHPTISQIFYRTTRVGEPENDYWLIYAYDDVDDRYLLLTIIGPDAHNQPQWRSFLAGLHQQIVAPWINGRLQDVI